MKLYSTLDRKIVEIEPIKDNRISIYSCGPTVYFKMHMGNIRAYINWDILHRALLYLGYDVKRVMNLTDVGHMSSNDDFGSDFGEDKMDRQAQREGITALDIANKYIDTVIDDFRQLHILAPNGSGIPKDLTHLNVEKYGWSRATTFINEIIEMIKKIQENGYTYETKQAIYFDISKIPDYTIFTGQNLSDKEVGVRDEVVVDPEKRNPADFVLWMKRVGKYENHIMNWPSPWGDGFPGWHIECSVMGTKILGEHFDIHTGGIDHVPVHHTNERAQNIGAYGHPSVKYWVHNEWLISKDDKKLSKSAGAQTLAEIVSMGFEPMDVRYLFASINYRTRMTFSIESLQGARNSRLAILRKVKELGDMVGKPIDEYIQRFKSELENNLNTSGVFSLLNDLLKSTYPKEDILATVHEFDKVLALDLVVNETEDIDTEVDGLLKQREEARTKKDFSESDRLRDLILQKGYKVLDTANGQSIERV